MRRITTSLRDVIKTLKDEGYIESRQKGTHKQFVKKGAGTITVPMKDGDKISKQITKKIYKSIDNQKNQIFSFHRNQAAL